MPNCSVITCKNRSVIQTKMQTNISYHRFPNNPYLKKVWTKAAGRIPDWIPKANSAICSKHFEPFLFVQRKKGSRTYIRDRAVPTLNLPVNVSFEFVEVDEAERNMEHKGTAQESGFEGNKASFLNNTHTQQTLCPILDERTEEIARKDEIIARQEHIIKKQNILIAQLEKRNNKGAKTNETLKGKDGRGRKRKKTAKTNS